MRQRFATLVPCCFLLINLLTPGSVLLAQSDGIVIGANVNMVSGTDFPAGDPFQRQQNEPSVAFSSRNSLHLLAGANDYRAVDVPGLPGGLETGDSWLSYFWSTNGGATWKSTLIPGYPQDPACQGPNPPTLCGYAAGADPVVRAGVNGMFYYSGIVFERGDPSRSAIFVSRFIDLNNDEGGDPIRFIDTTLIDTNDDGAVFLDKSWIGVDIPRATPPATQTFADIKQRGNFLVDQTVQCGNIYVGYAAIGGTGASLNSEIRLKTSTDCGDTWAPYVVISEPDSLNQGAHIAVAPTTGAVHVAWRRFETVETFLGVPAVGCPAEPSSWQVTNSWPTNSIVVGDQTYTREEAIEILETKHRGDETYKVAYVVIAAQLNLLTGGGDPTSEFDAQQWGAQLSALVDDANAWLIANPLGSDPKNPAKQAGLQIKEDMQEILLGSGECGSDDSGSATTSTGETNAIMIASSYDGGQSFTAASPVSETNTFDQGSTTFSFRTTAYPSIAVDTSQRVYVTWAARGYATVRPGSAEGDARIVVATSNDAVNWSDPSAVDDDPSLPGHQIKPSLLFAGGQLTLVFYDFRKDISNIFERFVVDIPDPERLRHTVDVRIATAQPADSPIFSDYSLISGTTEPTKPSTQASRYTFLATADPANPETIQAEYMPPNFPMFADGTTPFIGDYVDVAAPNLLVDANGTWRFAYQPGEVQVWQAVWSDNRDVIPPPDGDWGKYVTPISQPRLSFFDPTITIPGCQDVIFADAPAGQQEGSLYTGTRNQNVYSASISNGLIVAAPGNNRPLVLDEFGEPLQRGFVVYVLNSTGQERTYQLTVQPPAGIDTSFDPATELLTKQIVVPAYSSGAATVFAALSGTGTPTSEAIPVQILDLTTGSTLAGTVVLNNDSAAPSPLTLAQQLSLLEAEIHNPAIENPAAPNPSLLNASVEDPSLCLNNPDICVLNPAILNPAILNPAILNPAILNPAILNPAIFNPTILNPAIFNPAILNPAIFNPAILNPAILNPAIFNPAIFNPAIFNPAILNPAILNPAILNPAILNPAILNPAILNPAILNPAIMNPAILNPAILNTTATGDSKQVDVTFSVVNEGNATTAYDLNLDAPEVEGLDYELLVYRLNETPVADGCTLTTEAQQQLIFSQPDPTAGPVDGTFYLEPGEQVLVTFRVLPDVSTPGVTPLDPVANFDVQTLTGQVTSQPINTDGSPQPPADQFGGPPPPAITASFVEAWGWDVVASGPGDTGTQFEVCTSADVCKSGILGGGNGQYSTPTGITLDGAGNLYAVDWGVERVQVVDSSGSFLREWGGFSSTFTDPSGVALDASGNVYVADRLNSRIQIFDNLGTPLAIWGSFGSGPGQFTTPFDITIDDSGNVYVVDADAFNVQVFDSAGTFLRRFGWGVVTGANQLEVCTPVSPCQNGSSGTGTGQFSYATGIAVDASGNIYVSDEGTPRVQVFDNSGNFVRAFGWGVDTGANSYEICTAATAPCLGGITGAGAGQLGSYPAQIEVDADGDIYVADSANLRVNIYRSNGDFAATFGWGVDTGANNFEVCNVNTLPCQSGIFGSDAGQFSYPWDITISSGPQKLVYVSDFSDHRIQVFDLAQP